MTDKEIKIDKYIKELNVDLVPSCCCRELELDKLSKINRNEETKF